MDPGELDTNGTLLRLARLMAKPISTKGPLDPIDELIGAIGALVGAGKAEYVERKLGRLVCRNVLGTPGPSEDRDRLRLLWLGASGKRPSLVKRDIVLVPVRRPSPDLINGDTLWALVIYRVDEQLTADRRRALTVVARRAASFLAIRVQQDEDRRYRLTQGRLSRKTSNLIHTRDLAYQVAREIRQQVGFDDQCLILRLSHGGRSERALVPIARLGAKVSGKRSRPEPGQDARPRPRENPDEIALDDQTAATLANLRHYRTAIYSNERTSGQDASLRLVTANGEFIELAASDPLARTTSKLIRDVLPTHSSVVIAPVAHRERVIAVVVVCSKQENAFSQNDCECIETCSKYLSPLVSRDLTVEYELRDIRDQAALERRLYDIAAERRGSDSFASKAILRLFCERMKRYLLADEVIVARVMRTGDGIDQRFVIASGSSTEQIPELRMPLKVLTEILTSPNGQEWHAVGDGAASRRLRALGIASSCGVPLRHHRLIDDHGGTRLENVGILLINFRSPRGTKGPPRGANPELSTSDWSSINIFAELAATYLSTHDRLERRRQVDLLVEDLYSKLLEIELSNFDDTSAATDDLLSGLFSRAIRLVDATAGVLAVPCNEHHDLKLLIRENLDTDREHVEYGEGVTGACAASREPVIVSNSEDSQSWPESVKPLRFVPSSMSEIAVPLLAGRGETRRLVGVLDFESQVSAARFGLEEQQILERLARAAGVALELASQIQQLKSLKYVGMQIDQLATPTEIFEVLLTQSAETTGAYAASARMIDVTQQFLDPILHIGEPGTLSHKAVVSDEGVAGYVYTRQKTCYINDLTDEAAVKSEHPGLRVLSSRSDARCELCIPITWAGDRIGTINLEHVQPGALRPFVGYFETLASEAAYVLYQQRSRQRQLRVRDQELVSGIVRFSSAVAHDVVRHLKSIRNETEAVRDSEHTPERPFSEILQRIEQHAAAGLHETEHLLSQATDPTAPRVHVNVPELLVEVIADVGGSRCLDLGTFDLSNSLAEPRTVFAKRNELKWIFRQVLENSASYGLREGAVTTGSIRIELAGRNRSDLSVIVRDSGPVLHQTEIDDLYNFEKRAIAASGSGLGLPLAHTMVKAMNGDMKSEQGDPRGLVTSIFLTATLSSTPGTTRSG